MFDPLMLIVTAIVGVGVGIISGLLGVGGGTIIVPLFRVFYNFPALMATGTSLLVIIPTSISGAITHIRNKTCILQVGVAAGIGGALTSVLGVQLASISPTWMVMGATAVVIVYSAAKMFNKARKCPKPGEMPVQAGAADAVAKAGAAQASAPAAPAPAADNFEVAWFSKTTLFGFLVGMIAGVASGYIGLGGGFLMVPLFLSKLNLPMKKASGTSLIAVFILVIPAVIRQFTLGNLAVVAGLALAVGSVPGAVIGARLTKKVPERTLRFLFSAFLCVGAVLLVAREIGLL